MTLNSCDLVIELLELYYVVSESDPLNIINKVLPKCYIFFG